LEDLNQEEWREIFALIDFLKPFYEITQEIEGDSYPTLSIIYPLLNKLIKTVSSFDCRGNVILSIFY